MNENITRKPDFEEFVEKVVDLCTEYGFKIAVNGRGWPYVAVYDVASGMEMTHENRQACFVPREVNDVKTE